MVFVRLAIKERRSVSEVLNEWMADCAKLIGDADLFDDDSAPMPPRLSNAMMLASFHADQRERHVPADHEEWSRPMLYGHTEIALAIEG